MHATKYYNIQVQIWGNPIDKICIGLFLKGCGLGTIIMGEVRVGSTIKELFNGNLKLFNNKVFEIVEGKFMVIGIGILLYNTALLNTIH